MSEKFDKAVRRKARKEAAKEREKLVPEFKKFVNTELWIGERIVLAWRILWKIF